MGLLLLATPGMIVLSPMFILGENETPGCI